MAAETDDTKWILFKAGNALVTRTVNGGPKSFAVLPTSKVRHLLGEGPLFGQGEKPGESVAPDTSVLEGNRLRGSAIVFLGLNEPEGTQALPSSEFRTPETVKDITGEPYFGLDVSTVSEDVLADLLKTAAPEGQTLKFDEPRSASSSFSMFEAAIFAEARSMLDWLLRNKVGCL